MGLDREGNWDGRFEEREAKTTVVEPSKADTKAAPPEKETEGPKEET